MSANKGIEISDDMLGTITGGANPDVKLNYTTSACSKCGKTFTASTREIAEEQLAAHESACKGKK